jgi:hypothetical protein
MFSPEQKRSHQPNEDSSDASTSFGRQKSTTKRAAQSTSSGRNKCARKNYSESESAESDLSSCKSRQKTSQVNIEIVSLSFLILQTFFLQSHEIIIIIVSS